MIISKRAAQLLCLCGVLLLSACSSPSKEDMYRGERSSKPIVSPRSAKSTPTPALSEKRLLALKEFGLNNQSKPQRLVGLDGYDVKRALGDPAFLRKDNGVEIWQYHAQGCILDLFLYEKGGHMAVDHAELRASSPQGKLDPACFQSVLKGQS